MGYDVGIDRELCISSGTCVVTHGYFVFDSDGIATIDPDTPPPNDDELLDIARSCPSGAITLRRDGTDVEL